MLTENQVVDVTCAWLQNQGWEIESFRHGTSQGHDIFATKPVGQSLAVECKGAKSPKSGKPFGSQYLWTCVSSAFFSTARNVARHSPGQLYAMALPSTVDYRERVDGLKAFCERNGVYVFWVEVHGVTEVWQSETLFTAKVASLS